jgi:hypothetical protein
VEKVWSHAVNVSEATRHLALKTDRLEFEALVKADSRKRFPELFLQQQNEQEDARARRLPETLDEHMEANAET